jgi:hypothetical protein
MEGVRCSMCDWEPRVPLEFLDAKGLPLLHTLAVEHHASRPDLKKQNTRLISWDPAKGSGK